MNGTRNALLGRTIRARCRTRRECGARGIHRQPAYRRVTWNTCLQIISNRGRSLGDSRRDGIIKPGTVQSALVTGVLGIQPRPVWAEVVAWLAYLVPATLYVLWPRGDRVSTHRLAATMPVAS